MPFDEVRCPTCGYFHSMKYWLRLTLDGRPSSVARTRVSLGRAKGFKTITSFEDYHFFLPGYEVIRNRVFDMLKIWLFKGFLSIKEFKEAFSYLFHEERVKEAFISKSKPLLLVWRKVSSYREGSVKDVLL